MKIVRAVRISGPARGLHEWRVRPLLSGVFAGFGIRFKVTGGIR